MTRSNPRLTDERLKSWLDTNQLDRERLCQAVLALDGRFQSVRSRHPRGGPDKGVDIEARDDGGRTVLAAVGFRNSASDSRGDKAWVQRKFKGDLMRAREEHGIVEGFAFLTNVALTLG